MSSPTDSVSLFGGSHSRLFTRTDDHSDSHMAPSCLTSRALTQDHTVEPAHTALQTSKSLCILIQMSYYGRPQSSGPLKL